MKIYDLTVEYRKEPLGVDVCPRFFWKTDKPQQFCVIDIYEENKKTASSGKIKTSETVGVKFPFEIKSNSRYDVTVKSYGEDGEVGESKTFFRTGLLAKSDWKGIWVNMPANFIGNALLVRNELIEMPEKKILSAVCFVSGLGYYEFYVNGEKVSTALLNPAVSDPSKRVYYDTYDITDKLREKGLNVLGFRLGNGWLGQKTLMMQLYIKFLDGEVYESHTGGKGWWTRSDAVISNNVYCGEVYDANLEVADWCGNSYNACWDKGWMYTLRNLLPPTGELVSSAINDIELCGIYPCVNEYSANGGKVYDIGYNISGRARIKVKGAKGDKVTLLYAEDVKDDGDVNRINLRLADCKDVYILKGEGVEEYAATFTYRGFRYVKAVVEGSAEVLSLQGEHIHTNVRKSGSFKCSDETLNKLHDMAALTELNNLHSIMTDCPQRDERFMWLNDLSSRIFQSVNNFGMERVFSKVVTDISDTQDNMSRIADTAPYFTAQRPADPVSVCYLLFALRAYEWYGDKKTLEDNYNKLKGWTDFLISNSSHYIMDYFYYGDWVVPFPFDDKHTDNLFVSSAYLFWHICCMKKIAEIMGKKTDFDYYSKAEKEARIYFNKRFYNEKGKFYDHNTQTANAIALSLGLAPVKDREKIGENILADIKRVNNHSTCGNQGYRHLFYAMSDLGYTDEMIDVITNPEYPGWGYMVKCGATTVWERWEKEMQCEMHSFDHPMFGSYDGWFYEYLGGIRLAEGAYACNKIVISPKVTSRLNRVDCSLDTLRGKVVSSYKKENGYINYHIEIPVSITAEINIRGMDSKVVGAGSYDFAVKEEL